MKNYAKVGGRQGKPGYRTPATFRFQKYLAIQKQKSRQGPVRKERKK